jgi:hypothetical protein
MLRPSLGSPEVETRPFVISSSCRGPDGPSEVSIRKASPDWEVI